MFRSSAPLSPDHDPSTGSKAKLSPKNSAWGSFIGAFFLLVAALGLFMYLMSAGNDDKPLNPPQVSTLAPTGSSVGGPAGKASGGSSSGLASDRAEDSGTQPGGALGDVEKASPGGGLSVSEAPLNQQDEGEIHKAIEALDQGNAAEATQLLEGVLKRDPRNERALVEMAMMQLLDLKQPEQALGYLQRAFEVNPGNPMVMNELVSLFEEQSRLDDGVEYFTRVAHKNPDSPGQSDMAYGAGQMLVIAGKDQEAIPYLQKAVMGGGLVSPRAWSDLAEVYARLGDSEKSVDAYQKAIVAQTSEMQAQIEKGIPPQYGVQRMSYTKLQLAREYLKSGQVAKAQALVDEVKQALPGDESVAVLQKQIQDSKASKS